MLKLIKIYFQIISVISPKLATKRAFEMFTTVRQKNIRDREKPFYDSAKRLDIPHQPEAIHTYSFGNPEHETVLLVHGWDSNAGSLSKFVAPLLQKNKHVLSLNLPAHAHCTQSKTNILECKEAVKAVLQTHKNTEIKAIISHSFGSAVTGYALSEMPERHIDKLIFLTSPNKMDLIFIEFKAMIGLGNKPYRRLVNRANEILGEDLEQMYTHNKLLAANFNFLHIFHDKNDKIISIKNSELMVDMVPNSDLKTYENIGHYRMLWNDELITDVMNKIA